MLGTVAHDVLAKYRTVFVPNTVLVLKNVPIFHRSRFAKSLLINASCIESIFWETKEDRTIVLDSQLPHSKAGTQGSESQASPQ